MALIITAVLALAFLVLHLGLGGKYLVFALPAYAVLGSAGVIMLLTILKPVGRIHHICIVTAVAFFGYIAGRAWFSPVEYYAAPELYLSLAAGGFYLLVATFLTRPLHRLLLISFLLLLLLPHAYYAFHQFSSGDGFSIWNHWDEGKFGWRVTGLFHNPNNVAIFFSAAATYALGIVVWSRWPLAAKGVAGFLGILAVTLALFTASRGGLLCLSVSLFVFITLSLVALQKFYYWNFWGFYGGLTALAMALIFSVVYLLTALEHHDPVERLGTGQAGVSWRQMAWEAGIRQFQEEDRKLFGTGAGSHYWLGRTYRDRSQQSTPEYVHNDYIELTAEYGLLGAGLLILLVGTHGFYGWRAFSRLGFEDLQRSGSSRNDFLALLLPSIAILCGLIPAEIFDFHLQIPANTLLAAFALAVIASPAPEANSLSKGDPATRPGALTLFWRLLVPLFLLWPAWQAWKRGPAEYHFFQGFQAYMRDADYLQASEEFNRSISLSPRNPQAFALLGDSRRQLALQADSPLIRDYYFRSAVPALEQAIALDPTQGSARWSLALIYDIYGLHDQAEALHLEYLRMDPIGVIGLNNYATHKMMEGDWEEAHAIAEKGFHLKPNPDSGSLLMFIHRNKTTAEETD